MDVLIHVADGTIFDGFDYADRIEARLTKAGLTSDRCDLTAPMSELPRPALAHVFTGGETSVHSDAGWMLSAITTMRRLLAEAQQGRYSVIGICLGSQIIAEALRSGSIVATTGMEVGLTPVVRADNRQSELVVPSFHYQAISPEIGSVDGVRLEWGNDHTTVQAFSYGDRVFGCQFHPELSSVDVRKLVEYQRNVITEWGGDVASALQSVDDHADALPDDLFDRLVVDRLRVPSETGEHPRSGSF